MFDALVLSHCPEKEKNILFEGRVRSMTLPGVEGEFEILDFHKPILARLKKGVIIVDNTRELLIEGGIAAMSKQNLIAVIETRKRSR
jgi:F0F1-type ATP synthase epsilon subunit